MKQAKHIHMDLRAARRLLPLCLFALLLLANACARMGQPDGGWYDDDPPRVLGAVPADQSTGVNSRKITILFDEYIKLEDATSKVIVSPPQLEQPEINSRGKSIVVELKDTLKPHTTYTVDFSDAISDNNEGNPLGSYTYTFSTGEQIDTFEVAGYVLDASNLEPVKGILVGLYDDLSDTAFQTKPLLRVSRTDSRGHFVIKGVAEGEYRVYALQDADGNYLFNQKSEMIAYSHQTFRPSAGPDTRQDTIWRDSLHIDNILRVPYTHFYPDDVTLLAFEEVQTDRYLLKTERQYPDRFCMYFSYRDDMLPQITGLNFCADSAFILETNAAADSLTYWLRDTALVNQDTLRMEITYQITDTTGLLVSQTDTIEALPKTSYEKRMRERQKEVEKWEKEQEKRKKRNEPYDSIMPPVPLEPRYGVSQQMDPDRIITIEMPSPLATCDTSAIHLYSKIDTLWYRAPFEFHRPDSLLRTYELRAEWHLDTEYSFEVDSAAFVDIYGLASKPYKTGIKVRSLDEYGTLSVQLSGLADTARVVVELLSQQGSPVKQTVASDGVADFFYLLPGTYYLRAFVDANGNGRWDTGDYASDRQPEALYYYPQEVECKEKWDITKQWNLTARPLYRQKPDAIVKQKADKEKKLRNRNAERARQMGIDYVAKQAR